MIEIVIISLLILLNGFFSMSEIALVSSRKAKLQNLSQKGDKRAKNVLEILESPENFLSAVQIGITLIGVVAGAYGGVAISEDLRPFFEKINILKPYSSELAFASVVGLITYFSLVLGELIPKTIALNNPEKLAIFSIPFMLFFVKAVKPLVLFLAISTKLMSRLLFIKKKEESAIDEDELKILIEQGTEQGTFNEYESEIFKSIFRFGDRKANSIMTPRHELVTLDLRMSKREIWEVIEKDTFQRYPVCDGSPDKIAGIINSVDFLKRYKAGEEFTIEELINEPIYISEFMESGRIIEKFRSAKFHFAVVLDEHGSVAGIITLHNIIENILGELPTEEEADNEPEIVEREDGSWLVDGTVLVDYLNDNLNTNIDYEEDGFVTVSGFMMKQLDNIPKAGNHFHYKGFRYEVIDMDNKRVDKVLITRTDKN